MTPGAGGQHIALCYAHAQLLRIHSAPLKPAAVSHRMTGFRGTRCMLTCAAPSTPLEGAAPAPGSSGVLRAHLWRDG